MTESEQRFVESAIRRKDLFLRLSIAGVLVGLGLAAYYAYNWSQGLLQGDGVTSTVLVVLILLNARQNLRQYRYAGALQSLTRVGGEERVDERERT